MRGCWRSRMAFAQFAGGNPTGCFVSIIATRPAGCAVSCVRDAIPVLAFTTTIRASCERPPPIWNAACFNAHDVHEQDMARLRTASEAGLRDASWRGTATETSAGLTTTV